MTTAVASGTQVLPLGDRVVVRPSKREEVTRGGIVLPDTAKEKPQVGEVMAVGPGKFLDDGQRSHMEVGLGDRIIFSKHAGTEIKVGDEELLVLGAHDILAKLAW